jgi:hypothetical protein
MAETTSISASAQKVRESESVDPGQDLKEPK